MKPIDVLILETLATGRVTSAAALSKLWGEDSFRIHEWLEKFRKKDLCSVRVVPSRGRKPAYVAYSGRPNRIAEYLACRTNGHAK